MDCNQGKLRLFVKSEKVPAAVTEFRRASASSPWTLSQSSVRAVVYEHILDDSQAKLVEEARRLSCSSGFDLEVVDLGRMHPLRRFFWSRVMGPGSVESAGTTLLPKAIPLRSRMS